jgi:hypothetical protein
MFVRNVALVTEESAIPMSELSAVAAALQKQATRDFGPLWKIESTVTAFQTLEQLPLDYWPVIIKDNIGDPDAAGYHDDEHGQPFSLVQYSQGWTLTASHEVLEMLGDPFGRRLVAGQSPVQGQGRVRFLVEVCDHSEAAEFSYSVNGIQVSDFYTPHYFDPVTSPSVRYSYTGAITAPRTVLKGGYLSWHDTATKAWWQRTWFGATAVDRELKNMKVRNGNLRQAIDRLTAIERAKAMKLANGSHLLEAHAGGPQARPEFVNRATDLRRAIQAATRK